MSERTPCTACTRTHARIMAGHHVQIDTSLLRIFRITTPEPDIVGLLEISNATPAEGIKPVFFPADIANDIPETVIVEITEDEYEQLKAGALKLPEGWLVRECIWSRTAGQP